MRFENIYKRGCTRGERHSDGLFIVVNCVTELFNKKSVIY